MNNSETITLAPAIRDELLRVAINGIDECGIRLELIAAYVDILRDLRDGGDVVTTNRSCLVDEVREAMLGVAETLADGIAQGSFDEFDDHLRRLAEMKEGLDAIALDAAKIIQMDAPMASGSEVVA